ncbi:unnamed protein product [Staurois parvus]|uniref:Right-handed parallel beta-helix repeat-containing protein n=1 Tax=Staurois parvus TaxID=386267 RepID=A0ABN9CJK2_9NEOB|nr:unnamed protein product [Staurois parvus]
MQGSGETRYSEMQGPGRVDISECRVLGDPDIVNAGSRETRYSECRVQGDQI